MFKFLITYYLPYSEEACTFVTEAEDTFRAEDALYAQLPGADVHTVELIK